MVENLHNRVFKFKHLHDRLFQVGDPAKRLEKPTGVSWIRKKYTRFIHSKGQLILGTASAALEMEYSIPLMQSLLWKKQSEEEKVMKQIDKWGKSLSGEIEKLSNVVHFLSKKMDSVAEQLNKKSEEK